MSQAQSIWRMQQDHERSSWYNEINITNVISNYQIERIYISSVIFYNVIFCNYLRKERNEKRYESR